MQARARPKPVMNVTPLVDVVLVLLIIFMVVVPMMEKGGQVDLPSIFNIDQERKGKMDPITLSIARDGTTYLENTRLVGAPLEARLRETHAAAPLRRIVLRGDIGVRYEHARSLFALCQRIGFPGVALKVNARTPATSATASR